MWMDVRVGGRDGDGKGQDSGRGDERPQSARGHAAVTPPPLRNLAAAGSSKQVVAQSPISSNCYPQAHSMAITHKSSHPQLGHWPTT